MKRFIKCICATAVLSAVLLTACAKEDVENTVANAETIANEPAITVLVNGNAVGFDQPPVIVNDRTLVPLRAIFEALGASVDWYEESQTVVSTRNDTVISLTINSNTMYKNDVPVTLDVPAQIYGDRTLVPARAVAESFDCTVDWDAETRTVIINENLNTGQGEQQNEPQTALNHTYTTGSAIPVTSPKFSFDYSDNWTVTADECTPGEIISEQITLTSNSGSEISYMAHSSLDSSGGRDIVQYEFTKVADSQFVPSYAAGTDTDYSYLGNFVVAQVKAVGQYDMKTGELMPFDGGVSYAVIPESCLGTHDITGLGGLQQELSFEYASYRMFTATPSANGITDEELNEIIQILSSFRNAE